MKKLFFFRPRSSIDERIIPKFFHLGILLPLAWMILFAGCGKAPVETCSLTSSTSCWITSWTLDLTGSIDAVLNAIKNQDFTTLATFVWSQGVRFSPYENVNVGTDIILSTAEVENALSISSSRLRGNYDGSGEPINLWIGQYREKFVYDVDFATAPEVYYNQKFDRWNIINNIFDVYTGKEIVEYHFPQIDPQYEGMDWRSLYLVFENVGGQLYLIGIVHGQRTI